MKKIIFPVLFFIIAIGCNNEDDTNKPGNSTPDSIPTTRDGDTSSYEQMPNRVTDSPQQ